MWGRFIHSVTGQAAPAAVSTSSSARDQHSSTAASTATTVTTGPFARKRGESLTIETGEGLQFSSTAPKTHAAASTSQGQQALASSGSSAGVSAMKKVMSSGSIRRFFQAEMNEKAPVN